MPPSAATAGSAAKRGSRSWPVTSLPFDLQPDHEEEHGHQAVLNDVLEVLRKVVVAYRERHVGVPEVVIGVLPW